MTAGGGAAVVAIAPTIFHPPYNGLRKTCYDCGGVHDQFSPNGFVFVVAFGVIVAGPQCGDNLLARQVRGRRDSICVLDVVGIHAKETGEEVEYCDDRNHVVE
jgi:hypothetical protein